MNAKRLLTLTQAPPAAWAEAGTGQVRPSCRPAWRRRRIAAERAWILEQVRRARNNHQFMPSALALPATQSSAAPPALAPNKPMRHPAGHGCRRTDRVTGTSQQAQQQRAGASLIQNPRNVYVAGIITAASAT